MMLQPAYDGTVGRGKVTIRLFLSDHRAISFEAAIVLM
jgi:hypothetical protein